MFFHNNDNAYILMPDGVIKVYSMCNLCPLTTWFLSPSIEHYYNQALSWTEPYDNEDDE